MTNCQRSFPSKSEGFDSPSDRNARQPHSLVRPRLNLRFGGRPSEATAERTFLIPHGSRPKTQRAAHGSSYVKEAGRKSDWSSANTMTAQRPRNAWTGPEDTIPKHANLNFSWEKLLTRRGLVAEAIGAWPLQRPTARWPRRK